MKILLLNDDEKETNRLVALFKKNGIEDVEIYTDPQETQLILELTSKRDQGELKSLAQADTLLKSQKQYQEVVDNQTEMIVRWKADGQIIFANLSYRKYYQLNEHELSKKSLYHLVKDKSRFDKKLSQFSPANRLLTDIHSTIDSQGKKVWHEWTDLAVYDKSDKLIEIQSSGRDITKQVETELEIKIREEFSQSIFAAIHDSIAVIDKDGTIVSTNKSWKEFAKENNGSLLQTDAGCNYLEVCKSAIKQGDKTAKQAMDGITGVISGKKSSFEMEYACHSDKIQRWFILRATPFKGENGGAVITHTDITEKKNKDLELELSYKEISATQQLNQALISGASFIDLADHILESLHSAANVERGRIYLYDQTNHKLVLYAERMPKAVRSVIENKAGIDPSKMIPKLKPGSLFNQLVQDQKMYVTHDPEEIKALVSEHAPNQFLKALSGWAYKLLAIKTFGIYPLMRRNELIGVMSISTTTMLSDREKATISRFAERASLVFSRKMDQDDLKISEEKFRAISNYTANWETWIDTVGKPIWINPAVYNHSGYTAEELLKMEDFFKTIVFKDDYDLLLKTLKEALLNKTEGDNLEIRCNHKNGSTPWFSISWKQVYDSTGNWIGIRSSGIDITERKQQQAELIQKTNELKEAQSVAKLGTWEWNTETDRFLLSQQLCQIIGLNDNQHELTRAQLFYLVHPKSQADLEVLLSEMTPDYKSQEIEIRLNSLSGDDKYLLIRVRSSNEFSLNAHIVQGTALDISELKQSHIRSRENQEKFQKIFESIQDVYYQTNTDGLITVISPSVYDLVGYTPEELLGKPLSVLYSKPKASELRTTKDHLQGKNDQFEATLISKAGEEVIVSINLSLFANEDNHTSMIQGIMRNVTEQKRQEKSLENQRQRLLEIVKLNTQIIETSDHFYYVVEISDFKKRKSQLKYVSIQVAEILGLSELELLNLENSWQHLIHPEDVSKVNKSINKIFTQKSPQRVSYRIKHKITGQYIWVDDYACPLFNSKNEVIEIYGSVKDVSERVNSIIKITTEKKQSIAYQYQLLSSQLNPHFIYNTLNSFQYYILQGNVEASLNHISDFSTLIRRVLENSMHKFITLDEEISFLQQYITISKQRMPEELNFIVESCPDVETSELLIPPMLLQPYLENAIIHGFVESPRPPEIKLVIQKTANRIECIIEDNGIGRLKSLSLKKNMNGQKNKSYGIGLIKERIDLLNQLSENDFRLNIEDLIDAAGQPMGTKVIISLNCIYSKFV